MKDDYQIKQDVLDELDWDPEIEASRVGVEVTDGAVTLVGAVETYRQKQAAREAAKRVAGVRALVDRLEIELPIQHRLSDEGLAERVAHVLNWNVSAEAKNIQAEVQNGVVTLGGELEYHFQRKNILDQIEHVAGVVNVIDQMTVKPKVSASDVEERIKDALNRHAEIESDNVTVRVLDSTVTLEGTAESLDEMDRIEQAAWAGPGVTNVINNLRLG
jgi:osmotically-inducible protein OsmY